MSLLPKITSGIKWSAISYLGRQGMQFLTTAILARLILPDQFGLVGMALVVIGFLNIFKDLGTSSALIQRERLSSELLSSIFWINVLFGLFAMLLTAILAPLVADFYQEPQVTSILRGFSIIFPISGLSILHQSLLQRDQDFNKLGRIEIGAALVGSIVGISAALLGSGAWSLVYQSLAVTLMTTSLLWVMTPWRPNLYFSIEEVKSISNYSLNLVGFSIFNYFARNTDYILIGKFLGSEPLGYYTLAYQIMLYPVQIVSQIISRVMFPAYARIQDNVERFRKVFLKVAEAISLISFPVMFGVMLISHPFVMSSFGSEWSPTAEILLILAPVGMLQTVGSTVGSIYQARGRTDWMFGWGVFAGIVRTLAFMIGLRWGIVGVSAAYAISTFILWYPGYAIPFRLIDLKVLDLIKAIWIPMKYSFLMVGGVISLRLLLSWNRIMNSWIILFSSILIGMAIYIGLLLNRKPLIFRELVGTLPIKDSSFLRGISGSKIQ